MKKIASLVSLGILIFNATYVRATDSENGQTPNLTSAQQADYMNKLAQPTTCGNRNYLAQINANFRVACDQVANTLKAEFTKRALDCDHISMASPAIKGTDISQVMCVVRGGDVVFGVETNTVNYLLTSTQVKRLPADSQKARAVVDSAVSLSVEKQNKITYLIQTWMWPHSPQRPRLIQVIPVDSLPICNLIKSHPDSIDSPDQKFCISGRPNIPKEWNCKGSIPGQNGVVTLYTCNAPP